MGKQRRIRLKFHSVLSTAKKCRTHPDDAEPYFYKDLRIVPKLETQKSLAGIQLTFDEFLETIPKDVKSVEFFEFNKKEIDQFKKSVDNNDILMEQRREFGTFNSLFPLSNKSNDILKTKQSRKHGDFLKKFDVVNHARRLYHSMDKKKRQKINLYDIIPIYITMPTLNAAKCDIQAAPTMLQFENNTAPRKRLHSEKLKAIFKGNDELNALKSCIEMQRNWKQLVYSDAEMYNETGPVMQDSATQVNSPLKVPEFLGETQPTYKIASHE